ncbi:MAG: hypothetical protein J5838_06135 [Desulfovibrio sp.]|nr:hypothetical protein [Desulfovibrio sp.]
MSTAAPNEAQMKEALAEMAKASATSLKTVFSTPPAGKTWEEIEAGMAQGKSLGEICGLTAESMEGAYEEAKLKLAREDFDGAREIFSSLCLYDQQPPKFWGGLAKACEGLKHYEEAVGCYRMMALVTGGTEPLPYLGMGYCHLALNDKKSALEALEIGREVADPDNDRGTLDLIDNLLGICRK